ncbi:MAG: hypothetical protein, SCM10.04c [uncultured Nocardioidaceae bacterium]|uniref:Polynucleotide kinase PNKP phosphatase domain-containing protein n=1 Tax=uncultured Nocardioidaceae bacterium TaxID=253824 RepID=A0A6J4LUV2_9ACTN|nr:MAG: hypothetical protein, SCM10.04c [uncultured Nocardioidaceae bacterium]
MSAEVLVGGRRPLAVIDIDGVLADVRHRLHHVVARPKDWDAFFAAAPDDPVLETGLETARRLAEVCDLVYLSGRPERCRRDTLEWFTRHHLPAGELLLRRPDDRRPSRIMKVEVLDRLSQDASVTVLVDDDPLVCQAAREAGYDVLPAHWMGESAEQETLISAQEVDGRT